MAKITDLNIPNGLETQYYSSLSIFLAASGYVAGKRKASVSYAKRISLAKNSLFVKWQGLWASFDSIRVGRWTAYWVTLPFGLHSGTGGWPGSGYSAFIHVNAPRYMAGLELLLDPPDNLGPELLTNGNFSAGATGWYDYLTNGTFAITTGQTQFNENVSDYDSLIAQDNIGVFGLANFQLTITYKIPSGVTGDLYTNLGENGPFIIAAGITSPSGETLYAGTGVITATGENVTEILTFAMSNDPDICGFSFGIKGAPFNGPAFVYNLSLREILT